MGVEFPDEVVAISPLGEKLLVADVSWPLSVENNRKKEKRRKKRRRRRRRKRKKKKKKKITEEEVSEI